MPSTPPPEEVTPPSVPEAAPSQPEVDPNPRNDVPKLLYALGIALTAAIVQPIIQDTYTVSRVWIFGGLASLCFLGAIVWRKPSLHPSALRASAERVASDFRWWLAIGGVVWIYTCVMNALVEVRRNNEIVQLRNDVQSIAKVVDRLVMPRHLTIRQQRMISSFLLQFGPHEFAFRLSVRNEEASSFRVDIEQALSKGGWTRAEKNPYEYAEDVGEGLSLYFTQTVEHSHIPEDPRNPRADRLLMMALGSAGVRLSGSGGGSGANVTEDRLVINIGRRRMDSYELIYPDNPF